MAAGAQIYNDSGIVQIDDQYANLCLRQTGTATITNRHPASLNTSSYIAKTVDITYVGSEPIIALRGTAGGGFGVIATARSGNTWTFRVIGFEHAPTFNYYIFDRPSPTASGVGFEVYDANGNITFSSIYRPLEVTSFIQMSGYSQDLPLQRQYAIAYNSQITLSENSEHFTNNEVWTYWTYDLSIAGMVQGITTNQVAMINGQSIAGGVGQGSFSPVYPSGDLGSWGSSSAGIVIDVTGWSSTTPTDPNGVKATVNATSRTASGGGSGTTITDAITATASGGRAPYSYQWDKTGGDAIVTAYGATNTAALRTQVANQAAGTNFASTWVCKATDADGKVGYSPVVSMAHVQAASSNTPAPITLNKFAVVSNDTDVTTLGTPFQIAGITVPISMRFERYNPNIPAGMTVTLTLQKATSSSGPWTKVGDFVDGSGLHYRDDTATNGTWYRIDVRGVTSSGRKVATFDLAVWNLTRNEQLVRVNGHSVTVDNDYVAPDYTPNPVNWANISGSTNDASFFLGNSDQGFWGINQTITVRATISNVVKSSNIVASSRLDFQRNGAYVHDTSGIGNGFWTEATFTVGQVGRFYAHAGTSSGTGTLSYTVTVTNQSAGGAVLDTFTVSQTVDADNNHNIAADYTPDAFSVGNLSLYTNEPSGLTNASFFQIKGINQAINVQFTRGNQSDSGGIFTRRLYIYHSKTGSGGPWTEYFIGAGAQGVANITATNGDWFYVQAFCDTTAGIGQTSFTGYVTNTTTGVQMASYSVSATVDADNNYNVVDRTPNAVSFPNHSSSSNDYYVQSKHQFYIGGINAPTELYWYVSNHSSNAKRSLIDVWVNYQHVYQTTTGEGHWARATVNNGDYVEIVHHVDTSSGVKSASYNVRCHNGSVGYDMGSYSVYLVCDADNNYNLPSVSGSISGYVSQERFGSNYRDRGVFTLNVTGGTPSSYQWLYSGWSGQVSASGTNTKTATFTGPSYNPMEFTEIDSGQLLCNYVVNGITYSAMTYIEFNVRGGV